MKAYLLARVSSKDQEDNNSIPSQIRRIHEYALRNSLSIVDTYKLVESSTKEHRHKFHELISVFKDSDEIMALVVDTIDRLQRDFRESVLLDELRREGKIELHFIREGLIINQRSNSSDILRWDMGVMISKSYVNQLSDNVKRGLEQKILNGEWSHKAPFGYINVDLPNGKKWVEIDPLPAEGVRRIFEWYGTGNYSLLLIKQKLQASHSYNLSTSQLDRMLKNPFYMGEMRVNGKRYPHKYDSLISAGLFEQAEVVRNAYGVAPKRWGGLPFAYRGLISCADCGCRITFERHKSKYIYGHCSQYKGGHNAGYVPEEHLTKQVMALMRSIQIPEEAYQEVSLELQKSYQESRKSTFGNIGHLEAEIKKYEKRMDRLYEDSLDEKIPTDLYERKLAEYRNAHKSLQTQKATLELGVDDRYGGVPHLLKLSKNAPELFKKADPEQKRALINIVLQNFELKDKQLRWELKKPFDTMAFCSENGNWLGRRDLNPRMLVPKTSALPLGHSPIAASPYEDKPTVFPHRSGRGVNPTLGLLFFPCTD